MDKSQSSPKRELTLANFEGKTVPWDKHYYVSHKAEMHENQRFFSTGMEFANNAYAYQYVLKVSSCSKPHIRFFCEFQCLRWMPLNRSRYIFASQGSNPILSSPPWRI